MKTGAKALALLLATSTLFPAPQAYAQTCKPEARAALRAKIEVETAAEYEAGMYENLVDATRDVKYSNILQSAGLVVYIPAAFAMAFSAPFLLLALPGLVSGATAVSYVTIPITDIQSRDEEYFANRKLVRFAVSESYVRDLVESLPRRDKVSLEALDELFKSELRNAQEQLTRAQDKIPSRLWMAIQDGFSGGEAEAELHGYLYALAKTKRSLLQILSEVQNARVKLCEKNATKKTAP